MSEPLRDQNKGLDEPHNYVTFLHILDVSPASFLHVVFLQPFIFHLVEFPKFSVP